MRIRLNVVVTAVMFMTMRTVSAQSTFQNLDFEHPIQPLPLDPGFVPIADALPHWTGYVGGSQIDQVFYNTVAISAAAVSLQGPGSDYPSLQGNFSAGIQSMFGGGSTTAAIAQTGRIPFGSRSLVFLTDPTGHLQVSFAGQNIPLVQIGAGANDLILAGDISAFAGQIGELRFTSPPNDGAFLDDIQFSTQAVPEPSTLLLFSLGGLALLVHRFRRD